MATALAFDLPEELEAHEPPEAAAGFTRADVRLMVSDGLDAPHHAAFADLGRFLDPGDLLIVNTSGTRPAALRARRGDGEEVAVHLSTELGGGRWVVEVRRIVEGATAPLTDDLAGERLDLPGAASARLVERVPDSMRLWRAELAVAVGIDDYLARHGQPIRYPYVREPWPIDAYQTVFATRPGSAEMPSAARPFTAPIVTDLVARGVRFAPITLHTGVSSLERHEAPYAEWFDVPLPTAEIVQATRADGHRVVAVGTTAVRALESAVDGRGRVRARQGWTDLVITPDREVRSVDGLLTGWHEPEASHLDMLEAIAGRRALEIAYASAVAHQYRWHEFGDVHLILGDRP